ncbi:hypothetical protein [uncultured Sphingomonas sp.]|uniref:hypothetical protein n=1 Tax=uncultured Sphingomonas sp. TaxID=158754 RepID=UPI0025D46CEA|nr:hypothetical protein [uncultured Sphingomonas sp.]
MKALAAAALLVSGASAEARFAPKQDTPYRLVRVQEHRDARGQRRFESERSVTFSRVPGGYVARMELGAARDSDADSHYALLATAMGGRTIMVDLDAAGRLRQVRELDAIWARLREAIGQAATRDDLRLALWRLHDAATTTQREEAVAGVLLTALAPGDAERARGIRTVTLPSTGVGQASGLTGMERVSVDGSRVEIDTRASGVAGGLSRRRVVDRRTGLLIEQRDEQRGTALVSGVSHEVVDRTTVTLSAPVS